MPTKNPFLIFKDDPEEVIRFAKALGLDASSSMFEEIVALAGTTFEEDADEEEAEAEAPAHYISPYEGYDSFDEDAMFDCDEVDNEEETVEEEVDLKLINNLSDLNNYNSKMLLGLANLSEDEAIDYFLNKVMPNIISIVKSSK